MQILKWSNLNTLKTGGIINIHAKCFGMGRTNKCNSKT